MIGFASTRVGAARLAALAAAVGAALALAPVSASADPATESALRAFVTAIDGSPDWDATFQGISTDQTGATVMAGLKVVSAVAGMTIDVDTLTVARGNAPGDGRYAAGKVTAGTIGIAAGPLAVKLSNVSLDDFVVPAGIGFAFDPAKPFSSIARAYAALAKAHLGQGRVASLAVTETLGATSSRVTYNDLALTRLDGGRIATLSAGPLLTKSPVPDKLNAKPLVAIKVGRADARDIDLAALLRVYDPPAPGASRNFQPAVANATYRDASITIPGVAIKLGVISMDDFRVRPPEHDVAADLDRSISKPFTDEAKSGDPAGMINFLSAYSVGKFSATPIDVTATGIDTIHLDGLSMANLSLDGLGEFALAGFNVGVKDIASLKAGRIAFGGLTFPKSDVLANGIRTAVDGGNVDLSAVSPTLGFVELGALDASVTGFPSTHLGKLRLDFANNIGNVPTSVKVDIADTDLDAALMPGILREQLSKYGYQRLKTDVSGKIEWNESKKTTTVTGLKLTVKDVGTLTIDAVLSGPERRDFEQLGNLAALQAMGDKVALVSGTLSFKDDSIVGRVLADQANGLKVEPDKFRDQFARGLPFMLLPVGTADFQRKASPVLGDFIRSPGTITLTAAPAMPIALPALIKAAQSSGVFNLPTLLNLSIAGTPGPKPAVPAPAPAVPAAPAAPPGGAGGGDIRGTLQPPPAGTAPAPK